MMMRGRVQDGGGRDVLNVTLVVVILMLMFGESKGESKGDESCKGFCDGFRIQEAHIGPTERYPSLHPEWEK